MVPFSRWVMWIRGLSVHEDIIGVTTASGKPVAFQRSKAFLALKEGKEVAFENVRLKLDAGGIRAVDVEWRGSWKPSGILVCMVTVPPEYRALVRVGYGGAELCLVSLVIRLSAVQNYDFRFRIPAKPSMCA